MASSAYNFAMQLQALRKCTVEDISNKKNVFKQKNKMD